MTCRLLGFPVSRTPHDAASEEAANHMSRTVAGDGDAGESWDAFDFAEYVFQGVFDSGTDSRVAVELPRGAVEAELTAEPGEIAGVDACSSLAFQIVLAVTWARPNHRIPSFPTRIDRPHCR